MSKAICTETGDYVYAEHASKTNKYKCPECSQLLILKQGDIRVHHFSHKSDTSTCRYYDRECESVTHRVAKSCLADWLTRKKRITIVDICVATRYGTKKCGKEHVEDIVYIEGDSVHEEYRQPGYIADVAIINDGKVRYVFEILNTHRTTSHRPSPWFEIKASEILELKSKIAQDNAIDRPIHIVLYNKNKQEFHCNECAILIQNWILNIPELESRVTDSGGWIQKYACVNCKKKNYSPVYDHWTKKWIRVCKKCLYEHTEDVKKVVIPPYVRKNFYPEWVGLVPIITDSDIEPECIHCEGLIESAVYFKNKRRQICNTCTENPEAKKKVCKTVFSDD